MIVNIVNIAESEKRFVAKENVRVTYKRLIFDCYVFVINFKVTYINVLFIHIYLLLIVKVIYIKGDL